MRGEILFLCLLGTLAAREVSAQGAPSTTPSPVPSASPSPVLSASPTPTPTPSAAPPPAETVAPKPPEGATKPPEAGKPAEGTILLHANSLERNQGHAKARGFVDLQAGEFRIQADQLDLYETTRPDGGTARRMVGEGNVVFMRGEERLSGERLEMDLETNRGTFTNAMGFVSPGVLIEGRKIERIDADTYRIEGGKFTSCTQPNPRWSFSASSAILDVDDKIRARNVVFKVKEVPAFYLPYLIYPIEQDQRSTGFLFPHIGQSGQRGFNFGTGFFWAMGRSYDQTFYYDTYSDYGWGFGHEFRYLRPSPSRGTFRTYLVRRKEGGWEHDFNWDAIQVLPWKTRATIQVRESSTIDFREQFNDSLDRATNRTRYSTASLQRNFGSTTVQLLADSTDTFFGEAETFERRRHMPTLQVFRTPQKDRRTGLVMGFEARAENLALGNQDLVSSYGRYDVYPRISRPFSLSFLQLTPEAQLRWTGYGVSDADLGGGQDLSGPARSRRYFQTSFEMRGPTFSRVFNTPGNFYSERFKHTIGPEVTWTYRSKVEDFEAIPYFDGHDRILGTNEVNYALMQRFYSKRATAGGKASPYQFLTWKVSQTYYVDIAEGQNEFDPNYSSAVFGPGGLPSHNSPIQSRLRFTPVPGVGSTFDLEYDVNFREIRSLSLAANVDYHVARLEARWSKGRFRRPNGRLTERNTIRGSGRIQVFPGKLSLEGSADYNIVDRNLVQTTGRLRYDVQCCGFMAEVIKSDYNVKDDLQWRFAIELANIGSIGNFMGQDGDGGGFPGRR